MNDEELIAGARRAGPRLRASPDVRDLRAGWLLKELADLAERLAASAGADRSLAARARTLRAAAADEAALRKHTGEMDAFLAYVRWSGQARHLLGELASRLDPPAQSTAVVVAWCKGCEHGTASVPCPRCGGPACASCGRCPPCDGPVQDEEAEDD